MAIEKSTTNRFVQISAVFAPAGAGPIVYALDGGGSVWKLAPGAPTWELVTDERA